MPGKARRRSPERDGQLRPVGAPEGVSMVALLRSECSKATMLQSTAGPNSQVHTIPPFATITAKPRRGCCRGSRFRCCPPSRTP
jgi:hypothetical protein